MEETNYRFSPDMFKDELYEAAVKKYPQGAVVYLEQTRQVGIVYEVRATADGPAIKLNNIGLIPIRELRIASEQDIETSRLKDQVEKRGECFFLK